VLNVGGLPSSFTFPLAVVIKRSFVLNRANPGKSKVLHLQTTSSLPPPCPSLFSSFFHRFFSSFCDAVPASPISKAKKRQTVAAKMCGKRSSKSSAEEEEEVGLTAVAANPLPIPHSAFVCSLFPHLCPNGQSNAANWVDKGWSRQSTRRRRC
jgi:hypothetical protein